MRHVALNLAYKTMPQLLRYIVEPNRTPCMKIWADHHRLFETAHGSTHNHQTWKGGYVDHVTDGMNYAFYLYEFDSAFGRLLPFSRSDALLVFYLHDLEKPWRILVNSKGKARNREGLQTKEEFQAFREAKLAEYGIVLTPAQQNGLKYVEGEYKDYSSERRVMNELAAFCHKVDVHSARIWYDYPKPLEEEVGWTGAGRFRTP